MMIQLYDRSNQVSDSQSNVLVLYRLLHTTHDHAYDDMMLWVEHNRMQRDGYRYGGEIEGATYDRSMT
jgi:hypothetical protein